MSRNKVIKFYYFKVVWSDFNGLEPIELSDIFDSIQRRYAEEDERFSYEYGVEKAKLASVSAPYDQDSFYQLTFERLRDYNFPVRTKLVGDSTELELSRDEYLGEEVTVLYDHRNDIMMIQNNRDSLSHKAIELCLNALILDTGVHNTDPEEQQEIVNDEGSLKLILITERNPRSRIQRFFGMREVLLKTNILTINSNEGHFNDLFDAIQGETGELDAKNLDIEVKVTVKELPSSEKYLPENIVQEVLAYHGNEGVKKLIVKGVNADNRVDEVNLIKNKLSDKYTFNYEESRQISRHAIYGEMENIYKNTGRNKALRNEPQ